MSTFEQELVRDYTNDYDWRLHSWLPRAGAESTAYWLTEDPDIEPFDATAYTWGDNPAENLEELYDSLDYPERLNQLSPWERWKRTHTYDDLDELQRNYGAYSSQFGTTYNPDEHDDDVPRRALGQRMANAIDRICTSLERSKDPDRPWFSENNVDAEAFKWGQIIQVAAEAVLERDWDKPVYEDDRVWDDTITDFDRELPAIAARLQSGKPEDIEWAYLHGYLGFSQSEYAELDPYAKWRVESPLMKTGQERKGYGPLYPEDNTEFDWPNPADLISGKGCYTRDERRYDDEPTREKKSQQQLGFAMWTGINRLIACLTLANHPDAPRVTLKPIIEGGDMYVEFNSSDDVRKFFRAIKIVAKAVLEDNWLDPCNIAEDTITKRDMAVIANCDRYLAMTDEQIDRTAGRNIAAVDPVVQEYLNQNLERWRRIVPLPHLYMTEAEDPENPEDKISVADIALAVIAQGKADWLDGKLNGLGLFEIAAEPDAWKAISEKNAEFLLQRSRHDYSYAAGDKRYYGFKSINELLDGEIAQIARDSEICKALDQAWFIMSEHSESDDITPLPWWPRVTKRVMFDADVPDSLWHNWHFSSVEQARKMLGLVRDVIRHVYAVNLIDDRNLLLADAIKCPATRAQSFPLKRLG